MRLIAFIFVFLTSLHGAAQQQGSDSNFEMTVQLGKMLPSQIDGLTEILSAYSLRGAYRMTNYNLEFGYLGASGEGATWHDLSLSARADVPFEDLFGQVYIGIDVINYSASSDEETTGGGHVGGGISMKVARGMWFRTEMKFNFNPGVAMFILFGLTFDFESGGSAT